jgi:hypothetical protein
MHLQFCNMRGSVTSLCLVIVSMFDVFLCLFVSMSNTYMSKFDAYVHCV